MATENGALLWSSSALRFAEEVQQPPGRGDDDVDPVAEGRPLLPLPDAAVDGRDAEAGVAAGRMTLQEVRQNAGDGRRLDSFGIYHDRFERDADGRWWFAHRDYRSLARTNPPDWERELSVFERETRPLETRGDVGEDPTGGKP